MVGNQRYKKLAIRLPNWLGDTLMTYPLLLQLSNAGVDFTCFGHPSAQDIFSATDFCVVGDSRIRNAFWLARQYRDEGFSNAILCPSSLSALLPTKIARLPSVGHHFLSSHRIRHNSNVHRVEQYCALGRPFLKDVHKLSTEEGFIPINPESQHIAKNLVKDVLDEPFIAVCPYAANLHKGQNKEWPYWHDFINSYRDRGILGIVAKGDRARFQKEYPGKPVIAQDIPITAAIMRLADCVLTNDSGAMHLASFFGAPVLGIFGVTDANETRPWHGNYLMSHKSDWMSVEDVVTYLNQNHLPTVMK